MSLRWSICSNYFIPTHRLLGPVLGRWRLRSLRCTPTLDTHTSSNVASTLRLRPSSCLPKPLPLPRQAKPRQAPSHIRCLPRRRPRKPFSLPTSRSLPNQSPILSSRSESGHSSTPQSSPHTHIHHSTSRTTHRPCMSHLQIGSRASARFSVS